MFEKGGTDMVKGRRGFWGFCFRSIVFWKKGWVRFLSFVGLTVRDVFKFVSFGGYLRVFCDSVFSGFGFLGDVCDFMCCVWFFIWGRVFLVFLDF